MKILAKNLLLSATLLLLGACFLLQAEETADFAYIGLQTWFESMIISLFPFMVLMNLLIETGLTTSFVKPFSLFLKPIFRNTEDAFFVMLFGFLCGFPLGARCAVSLYKKGRISGENAQYLMTFSNNMGPSYMLGFVLAKICPGISVLQAFFFFYGVPLLYGILLRYTLYKKALDREYRNAVAFKGANHNMDARNSEKDFNTKSKNLLTALPDAIGGALSQITSLGGYMILFNALRVVPHTFLNPSSGLYLLTQSTLEISGGLLCIRQMIPAGFWQIAAVLAAFSFNGFCCHFQTFSLLQGTSLSAKKYMLHKIALCSITVLTYFLFCYFK